MLLVVQRKGTFLHAVGCAGSILAPVIEKRPLPEGLEGGRCAIAGTIHKELNAPALADLSPIFDRANICLEPQSIGTSGRPDGRFPRTSQSLKDPTISRRYNTMVMSTDPNHFTFHTSASLLINLREWDDKRSWEEFYGVYRDLVYGFACRSGLSPAEAKEATDEVFIRVAIAMQEFDRNPSKGSFRGWLMNLTRTQVVEKMKNRSQGARILKSTDAETTSPSGDSRTGAGTLRRFLGAIGFPARRSA
jgi:hypothetical protein